MAAITNYHKLGCMKQHIYLCTVVEAKILKSVSQAKMKMSSGSSGDLPCLFQRLVVASLSWLVVISLQCLPLIFTLPLLCCVSNLPLPPMNKGMIPAFRTHPDNSGWCLISRFLTYPVCKDPFNK